MLRLVPALGPRGVIDTQIRVYQRLKKRSPLQSESDLLNALIVSRIETPGSPSSQQEEYAHYEPILRRSQKTLEAVIWAILEYEDILSREKALQEKLAGMGVSGAHMEEHLREWGQKWRTYIRERVKLSRLRHE